MAFHRRKPLTTEDGGYFVDEDVKSNVLHGCQNQQNYLRNWYRKSLLNYVATADTTLNPIGTAAAPLEFYFIDMLPDKTSGNYQQLIGLMKAGNYEPVLGTQPSVDLYRTVGGAAVSLHTGVTAPNYQLTWDSINPSAPIELYNKFTVAPNSGAMQMHMISVEGIQVVSLDISTAPYRFLLDSQAAVLARHVKKGQFIRGYNGVDNTNSVGELIYLQGDPTESNVDSCYAALRQQQAWAHPRGFWASSATYPATQNMFGDGTWAIYPRPIFGEPTQNWVVGIVYTLVTPGAAFSVDVVNNTTGVLVGGVGSTVGSPTLLDMSASFLTVDTSQVNEIEVQLEVTGGELTIHNITLFHIS